MFIGASRLAKGGVLSLLILIAGTSLIAASPPPSSPDNTSRPADAARPAGSLAGASFSPLGPVRLVDSRTGIGVAARLAVGVSVEFAVAGVDGVPVDATAVSANLTITDADRGGYVSLTNAKPAAAPGTSVLNLPAGATRANGLIAVLSPTGTLWATAGGTNCAMVFDVTGYFSPGAARDSWYPLLPARIADTRIGQGLAGSFTSGRPRSLQVSGFGGVPAGASAVSGNLTTVAAGSGYIAVTVSPTAAPGTSTLNFHAGDSSANNLIAPLDTNGRLSITYVGSASVAVIFDVTGYFMPDSDGALFVPFAPVRVLDSRIGLGLAGAFAANKPRTLSLAAAGLGSDAIALSGNLTATGVSAGGYAYVQPTAGPIAASNLNLPASDTRANGFISRIGPADSLVLGYQSGGSAQLIVDANGYFASTNSALTVPLAAAFTNPAPGTTAETTASGETVSWTVTGGAALYSSALTQLVAPALGANCSSSWTSGPTTTVTGNSATFSNYTPGHCYRYQLALNGNPASTVFSGVRHFTASASKIPVLMYHLVATSVGNNLAGLVVDTRVFDSEMAALRSAGWSSITAADLAARLNVHAFIPDRTFVITFDDGNVDNYTDAFPILRKYGFVATFYIITNRATSGGLSWDQAAEMSRAGMEIASHTTSHTDVSGYSGSTLDTLIGASRTAIETELAARGLTVHVTTFCYPYGGYSAADEAYLRSHGWTAAFTEVPGAVRAGMDMEALPRVRVPRSYSAASLLAAMNAS